MRCNRKKKPRRSPQKLPLRLRRHLRAVPARKNNGNNGKKTGSEKTAVEKAEGAQSEAAPETQPESALEPGKPANSGETQNTENVSESVEVGAIEAATAAASEIPATESAANGGETVAEDAEMAAEGGHEAGEVAKEGEA